MTPTRWIIFGVICLAVLGAIIFTNKSNTATQYKGDPGKIITDGPIPDHVYGSTAGKVILIEYGDFECPACEAMYQTVSTIKTLYKDDLTFIFRNFPLTSIHPNALAASTAAEAAGQQGKFYEMFDKLYQNQNAWAQLSGSQRDQTFQQYAKDIGLNITKYTQDLTSSAVSDKINRDQSTAATFNVDGTPTFVLNGKALPSSVSTDPAQLQQRVQDALTQAGFKL